MPLTMSYADRKDSAWMPPTDFISRSLAPRHGTIFVSEPLSRASTFNGLFSGRLDFTVNKMDMDLNISLYELLANGDYVRLFSPTYEIRASYAADRTHRRLLKAGERQKLSFRSERLTSRQLQPGSRIAMVLSLGKRPDREINYGTGGDVSRSRSQTARFPSRSYGSTIAISTFQFASSDSGDALDEGHRCSRIVHFVPADHIQINVARHGIDAPAAGST